MDRPSASSKLLSFLLDNEDAFKSRGRLSSLYSDFTSLRKTNPDGYNANIEAWCKAFKDAGVAGVLPGNDTITISAGERLLRDLELRGWGRPACLDIVLKELLAKNELISLREFQTRKDSIYSQPGWASKPWQVLPWTLRRLGILSSEDASSVRLNASDFIIRANVEATAEALLAYLKAHVPTDGPSLIFTKTSFATLLTKSSPGQQTFTDRSVELLLIHLSRDRRACAWDPGTGVVKFSPLTASTQVTTTLPVISENDISIARLKTLIDTLTSTVEALDQQVSKIDSKARESVAAKNNTSARSALRSKKLVAATLEQRQNSLYQLQDIYSRIVAAADNVEMVSVMSASADVLKSLNAQVGGAERVEAVVDRLREEMQGADEVTQVLAGEARVDVDEAELDEEFEALEREQREKVAEADGERRKGEKAAEEERETERLSKRFEELDLLDAERQRKGGAAVTAGPEASSPQKGAERAAVQTT